MSTKLLYGVGNAAVNVKGVLFGIFTLYLYTTVMGLPASLVGIASAICLVWDACIDPYIGLVSDRGRWSFGRRHTPMLVGALLMGVSFWAYMAPPQGLSTTLLLSWLVVTSLMVRTTTSMFSVPYFALGAELSEDYHERSSITAIRGLLTMVCSAVAAISSFVLFFPETTPGVDPKLNYDGYPAMGLAVGIYMTALALVCTVGTLSRRPFLAGTQHAGGFTLSEAIRRTSETLRNRSFFYLVSSNTLIFTALILSGSIALHFVTYRAAITDSAVLSRFQVASFFGGVVGVIIWLRVLRYVEKATVYSLITFTTAAFMASAFLFIGRGRLFGEGNAAPILIGLLLAGIVGSAVYFLPSSMLADIVDEDELVSGERREGAFFGIFSLGHQFALGIALLAGGILLDKYVGLVPGQAEQSAQTVHRIAVLYGVVPAGLLLVAGMLTLRYALNRNRVSEIQQALHERRRQERRGGSEEECMSGESVGH
jgi:Na+/melibiose symporter-like transporter